MDRILDNLYFIRDEQPTVKYGDEECKNVIALTADEAATEIKNLREQVNELKPYMTHRKHCLGGHMCECGLRRILGENYDV